MIHPEWLEGLATEVPTVESRAISEGFATPYEFLQVYGSQSHSGCTQWCIVPFDPEDLTKGYTGIIHLQQTKGSLGFIIRIDHVTAQTLPSLKTYLEKQWKQLCSRWLPISG